MDRPAQHLRRSWYHVVVSTIGIIATALTPVAAVGTWLLVTDAEVAGEVAADGSLVPIVAAIGKLIGRAALQALAYL